MGICSSNSSAQVAPSRSLIDMINSFEKDAVIMDFIKKHPKSIMDSDEVCL
jgi:hypothetical protein